MSFRRAPPGSERATPSKTWFFLFGLHPWICGQEARPLGSSASHQAMNVPFWARLVPAKNGKRPEWRSFYLVFSAEDEGKIYKWPPKNFPISRYSRTGPASCMKESTSSSVARGISVARGPRGPGHSYWNVTNDKTVTKKPILPSVSVSFSIFRPQQKLTTILTSRGTAPFNSIFANKFKCITRKNFRVFVLKIAISAPYLTFLMT